MPTWRLSIKRWRDFEHGDEIPAKLAERYPHIVVEDKDYEPPAYAEPKSQTAVATERLRVAELQRQTAETSLEECEHSDLWEYAKAHGLAEQEEHPLPKDELVKRIRKSFGETEEPEEETEEDED